MKKYLVTPPKGGVVKGEISLNSSKSIANRALIIQALTPSHFEIDNLSNADDTVVLDKLLKSTSPVLDAGAGGTTYRFLTAYLSTQEGREVVLTGSERMQERPIGVLVDALRALGADITYEKNEGFPPLRIKGKKLEGGSVAIPAHTSSQYISSLLMIAPTLSKGLELELVGDIVSLPYIQMTINLMKYFGAVAKLEGHIIKVEPGAYQARPFFVEADWSAASYYYSLAMLSSEANIQLNGLDEESTQGDAEIARILNQWVSTTYGENKVHLKKKAHQFTGVFQYDFLECPDLAQTVISALASLKIDASLQGLKTLLIKETDRVAALNQELGKYGVELAGSVEDNQWSLKSQNFDAQTNPIPEIQTYEDHRMAMAIAPLALITGKVIIAEPDVVTKSYPKYWEDLKSLGFGVVEC